MVRDHTRQRSHHTQVRYAVSMWCSKPTSMLQTEPLGVCYDEDNVAGEAMVTVDDEQTWIDQAKAGDASAYRMLVEHHQHAIARLVSRLIGADHPNLDDVIQDVFVRAYFALEQFRGQAAFRTWLMRIAVNRCRDEQRRAQRRWSLARALSQHVAMGQQEAAPEPCGDTFAEAPHAMGQHVQAAVSSLPEKLRVVVTLKDLEGYSYEEVSRILQCKLGTVKSRHARAREQLRRRLEPVVPSLRK
jgi:RNA polymerase sigma-70 factor, ECF subfamily